MIELPIDDSLDISGWELTKALRLFRKSNPPLLEWLSSGTVYYEAYSLAEKMRRLKSRAFFSSLLYVPLSQYGVGKFPRLPDT